jgi:hypothetical protein
MCICTPARSLTLGPLVHHILVPLRMYLSPLRSARVRMLTASEPAPGSLIDRAPMCSPANTSAVQHSPMVVQHRTANRNRSMHA